MRERPTNMRRVGVVAAVAALAGGACGVGVQGGPPNASSAAPTNATSGTSATTVLDATTTGTTSPGAPASSVEAPATTSARRRLPVTTVFRPTTGGAPVESLPPIEVREPCPHSDAPAGSAGAMTTESSRLEPMLAQVLAYGGEHPDEFGSYGLIWHAGGDASVFIALTGFVGGWFHADQIVKVAVGSGTSYQDLAFIRTGGMYSATWGWVGTSLENGVGHYGIAFTGRAAGTIMYSYGYPQNLIDQRAPVACANPISVAQNRFFLDCQSTFGASGSPWLQWASTTVRAVYNSFDAASYSAAGGTIVVTRQNHPFFNSIAQTVWQAV
jgi:hypothetical protein